MVGDQPRQYEHTVMVWDRPYEVLVHKRSDEAWVAVGRYMGARIETQERSVAAALKLWQEAARAKGA